MKREEVLKLFKIKTLPTKVDSYPTGIECIAKVRRDFGDDDFAIFKDGKCVKDSGFRFLIKEVLQYYYDAPEKPSGSKLEELQRLAEEAEKQKAIEAVWDEAWAENARRDIVRPTERKPMQEFIKEHSLVEGNPYIMSNDDLNKVLDEYFA